MSNLNEMKRPHLSLIKVVEAIGILLRIPKSMKKSMFKGVPLPSNYDETVLILHKDFFGVMNKLTLLNSSGIPNDIAVELYSKTQEPQFDYESALLAGGLACRDLFNVVILILNHLQKDMNRIPVKSTNIYVVVDGSRSSYIALDTACHLLNHGKCYVAALTGEDSNEDPALPPIHLKNDLIRRCRNQYKLAEDWFQVEPIHPTTVQEMIEIVEDSLTRYSCQVLVLGVDGSSSCGSTEFVSDFVTWAAWNSTCTAVLAKSFSKIQPFTQAQLSRRLLVCVRNIEDIQHVFSGALEIMRPGDSVVLVSVVHDGCPIGDANTTRFGFGQRCNWMEADVPRGFDETSSGPTRPNWNLKEVVELQDMMESVLRKSQSEGGVRIEKQRPTRTVAQELLRVALEEAVDLIVLRRGSDSEVSAEVLQTARCTLAFTV